MNVFIDILIGLASNFLFLLLILIASYLIFNIKRRKKLYNFFNITTNHKLLIYISNLKILPGGSHGFDGKPRSFQGYSVTYWEYLKSEELKSIFYYPIPSFSEQPGILKKLLVADIQVLILPSPLQLEKIDLSSSIVTLGSPGYNLVSKYLEETLKSKARFEETNNAMKINDAPLDRDVSHGFLERIIDKKNKRSFFYAAGISEVGTIGSIHYLSANWEKLYKEYGKDKPFVLMLGFKNNNIEEPFIVYKI